MANQKFISIQEAADFSKKSVQTIRRAIKSKKLKHRRKKTPQGFNYLISFESLCEIYKLKVPTAELSTPVAEMPKKSAKTTVKVKATKELAKKEEAEAKDVSVSMDDFKSFRKALDQMIASHSEERQNFLRLINTLQEKIFVLENQVNLLQAPRKKWYSFWK